MNTYYIELVEQRSCLVQIKASSYDEAAEMVEKGYRNCEIGLDSPRFIDKHELVDSTEVRTLDMRKGILLPNFELEAFI